MGKKGGKNRMKRLAAPRSWDISRKEKRFVYKPLPGPHPISSSYPLGVLVRDIASLVSRGRELKYVLKGGKVLVDSVKRYSASYPVGLFDVLSVPDEGISYRLVPSTKGLSLARIQEAEAGKKLCSVRSKTKVDGGHIQYGLHDGRSIVDDGLDLSPGDAVLLEVPSQKVLGKVKLSSGSLGIVLSGDRAGQVGRIIEVKPGTISRERMVKIALPSGEAEIPSRIVFPVGTDKPLITVGVSEQ